MIGIRAFKLSNLSGHEKGGKTVLWTRPTQIIHFGRFFFFSLLIFPKPCKISHFFDHNLKILAENKSKYFPKFFLQTSLIFFQNFCVLGVIFADRPYLAGLSSRKTGSSPPWHKLNVKFTRIYDLQYIPSSPW